MADFLCPFCFYEIPLGSWKFVCIDSRCSNRNEPFTVPGNGAHGKLARRAHCPTCGRDADWLLCPKCDHELPNDIGMYESRILGLIGPKQVGKTHYIAVIINELRSGHLGRSFRCGLNTLDQQTRTRYNEYFKKPLFDDQIQLDATSTAAAAGSVPLYFCLTFDRRQELFGLRRRVLDPTFLPFFDTAGEDLLQEDQAQAQLRYLANSKGLVLLLDPLQIPSVRSQIRNPKTRLPDIGMHPADLIDLVINILRRQLQVDRKKQLAIPLAVAFTKTDALEENAILHPASRILKESRHDGKFNLSDCEQVHSEMRTHVGDWLGENFDSVLSMAFKEYCYFGITALGCSPEKNGRLPAPVNPRRIADPMLWLLWKMKLIEAGKGD